MKKNDHKSIFIFLRFYLFIFSEMGMEGERGGEKHQCVRDTWTSCLSGTWPTTQACALTGNQISDSLVHRLVLNPLSHTS